jgi:predicted DNA-binding transcriptional regulator AlpA
MNDNTAAALRPDATAALLSLSAQRLAKMRLEGGGPPYVKAGRSILYRREDVDAWLHAHRRRSTSAAGAVAEPK